MKLLDCTLRDGGYYNKWDFDSSVVAIYLDSMEKAGVDVVEIGFRSPPKAYFMGPYIFSQDRYLENLPLPKRALIGVMINANEYLEGVMPPKEMIEALFQPAASSLVRLVRIAIEFSQVQKAEVLANTLHNLGYKVGINLMQAQEKTKNEYERVAINIAQWDCVDILYFADSLGCMEPKEVASICSVLSSIWSGDLGIHTHDNKGLALVNSLAALDSGVTWCDATVMGMGRGAGNVSTEALLMETVYKGLHNGDVQALTKCHPSFTRLKQLYQWGANLQYHFAAINHIHPTFVQSILNDSRYSSDEANNILKYLAQRPSASFSEEALRKAVYVYDDSDIEEGGWDATNWLQGKDVLIVGSGPSVAKYKEGIEEYIKQHDLVVLFLNANEQLDSSFADATVVAHEGRALFDAQTYRKLNHPLIMPLNRMRETLGEMLDELNILDYGMSMQQEKFEVGPKGCILAWPLAFAYALSVVTQAASEKVLMVGFDGYEADDLRQQEMNDVLAAYAKLPNNLSLKSLTPTSYAIPQGSIFEPEL